MNRDPIRLRHDSKTQASLRDDLAIASKGAGVPYDEAQGLSRLRAALGGGAGPGGSPGGGAPPPGAAPGGVLRAVPWGAAGIGAGAAGVVLAVWSLVGLATDAPGKAAPPDRSGGLDAPAVVEPRPAPSASSPAARALDEASSKSEPEAPARSRLALAASAAQARSSAGIAATAPSFAPAPSASAVAGAATLAEEVAHLERVRALAAKDPAGALALVEEGHRRFTGGVLWLERETLAFGALMRLGRREEAAARGERILQRYPDSSNAKNIRKLLDQPPRLEAP